MNRIERNNRIDDTLHACVSYSLFFLIFYQKQKIIQSFSNLKGNTYKYYVFSIHNTEECILLSGKNGAGKSTLLNVLCGFLPADEGRIVNTLSIGYLPFEHPLYPHLTVLENLRYYYRNFRKKNFSLEDKEVQDVLQILSIDYLQQRIDQCSSGQAQKVGIACILLSGADLIIMDEPFVALDKKSSERLYTWIQEKKKVKHFLSQVIQHRIFYLS